MAEDALFNLYLSNSDNPQSFKSKIPSWNISNASINKAIRYRDSVEHISSGNGESLFLRNIFLNPFTDELYRTDIVRNILNLENCEQIMDDICRESFLNSNIQELEAVKAKSSTIINWLEVKNMALQSLKSKAQSNSENLKKIERVIENLDRSNQ